MSRRHRVLVVVAVLFCVAFTSANAQGYRGGWWQAPPPAEPPPPPSDSTIPRPSFDTAFDSTHFSGSSNCTDCHDGIRDEDGHDVSIGAGWSSSMMAHASRDPVFQAKFASERRRNPNAAELMSDTCLHCHAPMASIDARFNGDRLTLLEDEGILDPANAYHDQAMEGVSCTVCHQIEDTADLGEIASFSGGFTIPTADESTRRVSYGQYDAPFTRLMRRATGITPVHSTHMDESALCGTCHNLNTPTHDHDGQIVESDGGHGFPEQAVYSEWENSEFADDGANPQSCQACHMPGADGVRMSTRPRWLQPVDDFKRHDFGGANTVVLDMLNRHRDELGVTSPGIASAIESNRAFLKSAASLEIVSLQRSDEALEVHVAVHNRTGHKLPTGYPSRRVWIDFQVQDGRGRELFRSGEMNSDGGIVGVDADVLAAAFEPHRQVITSPEQVQVYESIMGDVDSEMTYTLLAAKRYLKDNRIPPAGFVKTSVPESVAVHGDAYDDVDFEGGRDTVIYRIPLSTQGSLSINVALRYQPLSAGYMTDLFRDDDEPLVARLKGYWSEAKVRAETLATATMLIER